MSVSHGVRRANTLFVVNKGEIQERRIENANVSERGQKGAELRRSPDYLMPELFLDNIHYMCIFYSVFRRSTTVGIRYAI